jgi:hypothetical protein
MRGRLGRIVYNYGKLLRDERPYRRSSRPANTDPIYLIAAVLVAFGNRKPTIILASSLRNSDRKASSSIRHELDTQIQEARWTKLDRFACDTGRAP